MATPLIAVLGLLAALVLVSYPVFAALGLLAGSLGVLGIDHTVRSLATRYDGRAHTINIPRVGELDFSFTAR